jgi:hypothetical protein
MPRVTRPKRDMCLGDGLQAHSQHLREFELDCRGGENKGPFRKA